MKLPVVTAGADPTTLWRRYADVLADRLLAIGEDVSPPFGRGVIDGADGFVLLPEATPRSAHAEIVAALVEQHASTLTWILPPGEAWPSDAVRRTMFRLYRVMRYRSVEAEGAWQVLPGRAARGAYARVCQATEVPAEPLSARRPAHLDDPQFDGMVVLNAGVPLAIGGLQTRGQVGGVFDLCVAPAARRQGVGRFLLGRVLELAARSQLPDVFASVAVEDAASVGLVESAGFAGVIEYDVVTTAMKGPNSRAL